MYITNVDFEMFSFTGFPLCTLIFQNESNLFSQNKQVQQISSDSLEGLELLFANENFCPPVQDLSHSAPLVSKNLYDSLSDEESSQNKSSPCGMYSHGNEISSSQFEEESSTPQAFSPSSVHQTASQSENMEASVNRSNVSIWSRRGKPNSVLIETCQSNGKSVSTGTKAKAVARETYGTELLKNHFASLDNELIFTPDKENCSPSTQSLMKKSGKTLPIKSILNTTISSFNLDKDDGFEVFTPGKENITPNSSVVTSMKCVEEGKHQNSYRSSPLKTTVNCSMYQDNDDELFTPDKENITPNSRLLRSMKYMEDGKHQKSCRSSPLKTAINCNMQEEAIPFSSLLKDSQNRNILEERRSTNSSSKSHATLKKKIAVKASRADKDPFQPLSINITCNKASSQPSPACQITCESSRSLNWLESEEVIPQYVSLTSSFSCAKDLLSICCLTFFHLWSFFLPIFFCVLFVFAIFSTIVLHYRFKLRKRILGCGIL